jgi:hypothetical protein
LKKKYDDLSDNNSLLLSKQQAFKEVIKELLLQIEILKNSIDELTAENKKQKQDCNKYLEDIIGFQNSFNIVQESKNKVEKN